MRARHRKAETGTEVSRDTGSAESGDLGDHARDRACAALCWLVVSERNSVTGAKRWHGDVWRPALRVQLLLIAGVDSRHVGGTERGPGSLGQLGSSPRRQVGFLIVHFLGGQGENK